MITPQCKMQLPVLNRVRMKKVLEGSRITWEYLQCNCTSLSSIQNMWCIHTYAPFCQISVSGDGDWPSSGCWLDCGAGCCGNTLPPCWMFGVLGSKGGMRVPPAVPVVGGASCHGYDPKEEPADVKGCWSCCKSPKAPWGGPPIISPAPGKGDDAWYLGLFPRGK